MIDIRALSDEKVNQLIEDLNHLIESGISVEENSKTLRLLELEKSFRENQGRISALSSDEMKDYRGWREGGSTENIPEAIVVDDITLTSNTININLDEILSDSVNLDNAFRYHNDGHIDYSKLSKQELEKYMDAYASLIERGVDVEKSETILADIMAIYIKLYEEVPTDTIAIMKVTDWDGALKEKVEKKTSSLKIPLPDHKESRKKSKRKKSSSAAKKVPKRDTTGAHRVVKETKKTPGSDKKKTNVNLKAVKPKKDTTQHSRSD